MDATEIYKKYFESYQSALVSDSSSVKRETPTEFKILSATITRDRTMIPSDYTFAIHYKVGDYHFAKEISIPVKKYEGVNNSEVIDELYSDILPHILKSIESAMIRGPLKERLYKMTVLPSP